MADHLEYIKIHGMESADTEVFQGVVSGGLSVTAGEEGAALNLDTGPLNDTLKTALLYEDDTGTHSYLAGLNFDLEPLTSLLQLALLTGDGETQQSLLQQIVDRLADLGYNDEVIDFGFCRVHLRGKIIEY